MLKKILHQTHTTKMQGTWVVLFKKKNKRKKQANKTCTLVQEADSSTRQACGVSEYFFNEQSLNLGRKILAGSQRPLFEEEDWVFCVKCFFIPRWENRSRPPLTAMGKHR